MKFKVIDKKTGTYPILERIAQKENWAKHLCSLCMDGFAICEDGTLILCDSCGNYAVAPDGRFEVLDDE